MNKLQEFCTSHRLKEMDCKGLKLIFDKISKGMSWDEDKTLLWLETENPFLGGSAPVTLVKRGRIHKLVKFVVSCLEENKP